VVGFLAGGLGYRTMAVRPDRDATGRLATGRLATGRLGTSRLGASRLGGVARARSAPRLRGAFLTVIGHGNAALARLLLLSGRPE
jgi:hypothetical protein